MWIFAIDHAKLRYDPHVNLFLMIFVTFCFF
jgi:hypothetical protein